MTTIPHDNELCTFTVEGAMTIYEAAAVKEQLLAALARAPRLAIDLSRVDQFDTAGVQLLVLAQREAERAGKPVDLAARSSTVDEVLQRYGLIDAFSDAATAAGGNAVTEDLACERSLA